jgi:hypothetical protein
MKCFKIEDKMNIECSKKIEENISSMLKDLMNCESSGDESMSKSDSEIFESNIDIISFESSLPLEDDSKFILKNLENIEVDEINRFGEKSFENNIYESIKQNEFNDSLKLNHRIFSLIKNLKSENRGHNTSIAEDITNVTNPKKSIFYLNEKKSKRENLFVPKNFSFFSQTSHVSQDIFGFSQDQNFSFDSELEKLDINSEIKKEKIINTQRKNISLFDKKIFKTHLNNNKDNKIYSNFLDPYAIANNNSISFNKNDFSTLNNYTSLSNSNSNSSYNKNENSSLLQGNSRRSDLSSIFSSKK